MQQLGRVASMAYGGHQLFRWSQPRAPGAQMRQLRDLFVDGAEGLAGNTVRTLEYLS